MALFALWPFRDSDAIAHRRLDERSHLVPEVRTAATIRTEGGVWQLSALACATCFYPADAQLWRGEGEACVIHGLLWRQGARGAETIDAAEVARLLARPGDALPGDVAGEYAVARLYRCGTLAAFSDPAGIHQLFHRPERPGAVASRAGFLAEEAEADPASGRWLAAVGYRVGDGTGWRGVRQLPQATMLVATATRAELRRLPEPASFDGERGFDEALLARGVAEGRAAIRLAAGDGPLDLPVTGGKDSRAVLALALAAGLKDRLTLTTRGPSGHPDVRAAETIARALGVPHRREPPRGSDGPADMDVAAFVDALAAHAWQTDGGMGGWDLLIADRSGVGTLVTGHMGEVLKGYAKRPPDGSADPLAMVRLQSPFDPLELLHPHARAAMADELARQMAEWRDAGAEDGDLPDLFYYRNRLPNWLGGIRCVRSHERQPVMPLGVPSLQRLAWRVTAAERRAELIHWRIVRDCAPALAALPFAHQRWPAALGAPDVPPLLAEAGAALFGNWQWSVNHVPAIRAWLSDFFARTDIALWEDIDRARLLAALRHRRFDYADLIGLLGLAAHAFHAAGLVRRQRIGGPPEPPILPPQPIDPERPTGHLDLVRGGAAREGGTVRIGDGRIELAGWAWRPDWPGATPVVEALADGAPVAAAPAAAVRADLAAAGIGDGGHGFTLSLDAADLAQAAVLEIPGVARLDIVR